MYPPVDADQTTRPWTTHDLTQASRKYSGSITHGALTCPQAPASIARMPHASRQQGCDTQDMVVVHRAFRREFRLLPRLVRTVPAGDCDRAGVVAAHARNVLDALQHHHEGEDALIWPRLHARTEVPQALVYLMESQHAAVAELMQLTGSLLDRWSVTGSATSREELAVVLDHLDSALAEHLDDEERSVLPIVARTLTTEEWDAVGTRSVEGIPRPQLMTLFAGFLEDATEDERSAFLKKLPMPGRLYYWLVGRRRYENYVNVLRHDLAGHRTASTPARPAVASTPARAAVAPTPATRAR
jgi:hemerythrin-like domain-containing protein